jgi:hypothetical protein
MSCVGRNIQATDSCDTRSIQCHYASVWRELVAFRVGEMQPGAGDTSSRQTEADATAFLTFRARDERAGNDEGGSERH